MNHMKLKIKRSYTILEIVLIKHYVWLLDPQIQNLNTFIILLQCAESKLNNSFPLIAYLHILKMNIFRSFYGYHRENSKFLKILFYNPYSAKIAVDLLQVKYIFV